MMLKNSFLLLILNAFIDVCYCIFYLFIYFISKVLSVLCKLITSRLAAFQISAFP